MGILKEAVIGLKWEITPWVHTFLEHTYEFESRPVRPIHLTAHSLEGSHKFTKKSFSFSLGATKRRNTRSGLCDLIHRDNVKLGLIARGIFPWDPLKLSYGDNLFLGRGSLHIFLYICKKFYF